MRHLFAASLLCAAVALAATVDIEIKKRSSEDCINGKLHKIYEECGKLDPESLDLWKCQGRLNDLAEHCVTDPEALELVDLELDFWKGLKQATDLLLKGHRGSVFGYLQSVKFGQATEVKRRSTKDCLNGKLNEIFGVCLKLDQNSTEFWRCQGRLNDLADFCVTEPEDSTHVDLELDFWKELRTARDLLYKGHRGAVFDYLNRIAFDADTEVRRRSAEDCVNGKLFQTFNSCKHQKGAYGIWMCQGKLNELAYYCVSDSEALKIVDLEQSFWKGIKDATDLLFGGQRQAVFDYLNALLGARV